MTYLHIQPQEDEPARLHVSTLRSRNSQTNHVKRKHNATLFFVLTSPIAASKFLRAIATPFRIRLLRLTVMQCMST